jgi:DNA-binding LytR/AlgR family response regulator
MSIQILIVEDEFTIALDIESRLESMGYHVVGIADSYEEALSLAQKEKPNLILMDINIKGQRTGIDTARDISQLMPTPIIFLTALLDDTSFQAALKTQPYGYITKPFKDSSLKHGIEIALQKYSELQAHNFTNNNNSQQFKLDDLLFVKDKNRLLSLNIRDILWVEAFDNYVIVMTATQKIIVSSSLKDLADRLPSQYFMRIHRSYIVQLSKIKKIEEGDVFITDKPLPISKSYKEELMQRINVI